MGPRFHQFSFVDDENFVVQSGGTHAMGEEKLRFSPRHVFETAQMISTGECGQGIGVLPENVGKYH
jgi:hypothetical protein